MKMPAMQEAKTWTDCAEDETLGDTGDSDYDSALSEEDPAPALYPEIRDATSSSSGPRIALGSADTAADSPTIAIGTEALATRPSSRGSQPHPKCRSASYATKQEKTIHTLHRHVKYERPKTNAATPTD